ncbi:MAG: tRNA nucleotidyltransferase, partial [Ruminococcus sp.]|nr:tRNA nucleotidyltransferase [Ruminococcus sp.]
MDINIPENVKKVIERLNEKGYEAFIVGGCVRDSLLGLPPKDYDVTTNALPEEIISCFEEGGEFKVYPTGIKHGTVTVVCGGNNTEVTTYRVDGSYSDHRRPDSVTFSRVLEEDLARRDFTVNAMAYSDERGIIDPYGGQRDLFAHKIRCVGSPDERFEEDALRIMRALRFASALNFRIDRDTSEVIHRKRSLLREISAERISGELTGFVMGDAPAELMMEFDDVFCTVIPEFAKCIGFNQRSRYHIYDVWEHTVEAVGLVPADP